MLFKEHNKQSTLFIGILTSIVLVILILFTFIAKRLYISDSKKLLSDIYIDSIHSVQDKTISNLTFSVNQLNKFSNQITKTNEFRELYESKNLRASIPAYINYTDYYKSLVNCKYIGIYDKRQNSFLHPETAGFDISVLENVIEEYNNGLSFYCSKSDDTEYVTYTTNTYNGFITIFVLSQNFFEEIYSNNEKYPIYIFWDDTIIYSSDNSDNTENISQISESFKNNNMTNGYMWVNNILYVCKKSANYSVISEIPKSLMNDYFSSTLNKISKILYMLLILSMLMCIFFFCFSEHIFKRQFGKAIYDTKANASKLVAMALNHAFIGELLTTEDYAALENKYSGYNYFRAVILQLDNFPTIQRENTPADISHIFSKIKAVCLEKATELNPIITRPHTDCIGMIIASENPVSSFVKSLSEIQKYAKNALNLTLTCAISDEASGYEQITDLCRSAYMRREQRFFTGFNSIISTEDSESENKEYPIDIENKIISALDANKFDECYNYIEQFIKIIHECNATCAREHITQLTFSIIKSSEYVKNNKKNNILNFEFIHRITECETIDRCINLIATIIPIFETPSQSSEISFLQLVLSMIEREYQNPDFDLNMIAEQLNLTPHYVGHKFQKLFGKTFSSHLAEYRIDKSKKLLTETDWKISYISTKCGFNSSSYFIRIFKKYTTISPSAYRELYKQIP